MGYKSRLGVAAGAFLAAASCVTDSGEVREISARASETLAKYDPVGESRQCISIRGLRSIKVLEDQLILVELSRDRIFLNQPETACGGATGITRRLEYSTFNNRLCSGELVRVVDNASDTYVGSCILSDFHELAEKPSTE